MKLKFLGTIDSSSDINSDVSAVKQIASRRSSFEKARSIAALEGYDPTHEDLADQELIIRGEVSIEDSIAKLKKKHTRRHTVAA